MKIKREGNIKEKVKWETKKIKTRKSKRKRERKKWWKMSGKRKIWNGRERKERKTGANIEID